MKEQFLQYWQSRSARDRQVIAAISALVLVAVLYAYLWLPMNEARARLRAELPKLRGGAEQMELQAREVQQLKAMPAPVASGAAQDVIVKAAERAGMKGDLTQVTSLSTERIQITLNAVSFDRWIDWSRALAGESALRIESAQVSATGDPGMVKVQAVLALPAK
jgi:general secretion pathway protein M